MNQQVEYTSNQENKGNKTLNINYMSTINTYIENSPSNFVINK